MERQETPKDRPVAGKRGRPEAAVRPEDGPAAVLATELRQLREQAGRPSYRDMSPLALVSPSALSEAARGRRWPSLLVVEGYARACGAELGPWRARWEELRPAADRSSSARSVPPMEPVPAGPPAAPVRPPSGGRRWWPPDWLVDAGAGAILLALAAVALWQGHHSGTTPAPRVSATPTAAPSSAGSPSSTGASGSAAPAPGTPVAVRRRGTLAMIPGEVADLDSFAADWTVQPGPGPATADIWFGAADHALHGVGNFDIAVLPAGEPGGFWPCALEQDYGATLAGAAFRPGAIVCALTAANRVAELDVTSVHRDSSGDPDQVAFKVTVWVPLHRT